MSFWFNDPNILLSPNHLFEIFPTEKMEFYEKLNAITRLVILVSFFLFSLTKHYRIFLVLIICLVAIYLVHLHHEKNQEGYLNPTDTLLDTLNITPTEIFATPTMLNPFSNIMVTDYDSPEEKKIAPPAYDNTTNEQILEKVKESINYMNPEQKNLSESLFGTQEDSMELDLSMRQFMSMPSTTFGGDQDGFAQFCYGDAISAKEGNLVALARHNARYNLM